MTTSGESLKDAIAAWCEQVVDEAADRMPDAVRPDAPLGKPDPLGRPPAPGGLRRGIRKVRGSRRREGAVAVASVEAQGIQAVTTTKGARPHVITPRGPGYPLRFVKMGRVVRTFRVQHPGNPADDWWTRGLRKRYPQVLRDAARAVPFRRR